MSTEMDAALAKIDHHQRTLEFAQALGCSYPQAQAFTALHKDKFKWNGAVLSWGATGRPAADEVETVKKFMVENDYKFLLPDADPLKDTTIKADPAMIQSALDGNITAKGKLLRDTFHGDMAALETALTARREKAAANKAGRTEKDVAEHRNNPFSAAGWNVSRQGQLVKAMGEKKAADIAAAVGCTLGSTKPNPHYN
jgi:hypothetical protein